MHNEEENIVQFPFAVTISHSAKNRNIKISPYETLQVNRLTREENWLDFNEHEKSVPRFKSK
jgi:hypothetical protein